MKKVKARQFGKTLIQRGICSCCGEPSFICKDMTSSCCSAPVRPYKKGRLVFECGHTMDRKPLSPKEKKRILELQDNKCYWCDKDFGTWVASPSGFVKQLTPVYDHYIPYWYTHSSHPDSFVASCNNCNSYKSGKIILTKEEENMKEYVTKRFYQKGWIILD